MGQRIIFQWGRSILYIQSNFATSQKNSHLNFQLSSFSKHTHTHTQHQPEPKSSQRFEEFCAKKNISCSSCWFLSVSSLPEWRHLPEQWEWARLCLWSPTHRTVLRRWVVRVSESVQNEKRFELSCSHFFCMGLLLRFRGAVPSSAENNTWRVRARPQDGSHTSELQLINQARCFSVLNFSMEIPIRSIFVPYNRTVYFLFRPLDTQIRMDEEPLVLLMEITACQFAYINFIGGENNTVFWKFKFKSQSIGSVVTSASPQNYLNIYNCDCTAATDRATTRLVERLHFWVQLASLWSATTPPPPHCLQTQLTIACWEPIPCCTACQRMWTFSLRMNQAQKKLSTNTRNKHEDGKDGQQSNFGWHPNVIWLYGTRMYFCMRVFFSVFAAVLLWVETLTPCNSTGRSLVSIHCLSGFPGRRLLFPILDWDESQEIIPWSERMFWTHTAVLFSRQTLPCNWNQTTLQTGLSLETSMLQVCFHFWHSGFCIQTQTICFRLKFRLSVGTCGGSLDTNGDSVDFSSPGWPGGYLSGLHCEWTLSAPTNHRISLSLKHVHLEADCKKDSVIVYDGNWAFWAESRPMNEIHPVPTEKKGVYTCSLLERVLVWFPSPWENSGEWNVLSEHKNTSL